MTANTTATAKTASVVDFTVQVHYGRCRTSGMDRSDSNQSNQSILINNNDIVDKV